MLKPINHKLGLSVAVLLMLSLFTQVLPRPVITIANAAPKTESTTPVTTADPVNEVGVPKAEPAPTAAPDGGPSIVATLTDNVTAATKVAPGGTINYTATITNNGVVSPGDDATGVNFSDPLDANTTLVAGSVHASPIAFNDTYNWVGNTFLDTAARALPAVTANDVAVNAAAGTDTFTVTAIAGGATALGGSVTLASPSGAFTYTPPLGRPNAVDGATAQDSFTYTITNNADPGLTSTGTVKINLTGRVWYLQAGAAGDGRSNTPSGSPSAMSTAADKSTDVFYIFSNAGSLNGAFSVDAGQQLLGQGVNLVVSSISLFTAAAPTPTTTNTAGNCVSLAGAPGNNTLSGFNIGNCTGGTAITGANVGTLNVSTMSINTNGGGLDLTGVSTPTVSVVLGGLTSSGGAKNVNLVGLNGTFTLAGGALSGASNNAFDVNGGAAGITYSGTISNSTGRQVSIVSKTGGTVALSGAVSGTGTGIFLNTNSGATINFTGGITLSTGTNDAFTATGGGTVNVSGTNNLTSTSGAGINWNGDTSSTSVTFNNVSSTTGAAVTIASSGASDFTFNDVTSTTGTAVNVNTATGDFIFHAINANGAATGISITSATGTFTVNGTSTTAGTGGTVQNCTAKGADIRTSNNITLKNMNFTNNATANLGAAGTCGDALNGTNGPTNCNANISLSSVTTATLSGVTSTGSKQIGIDVNGGSNLTLTNVTSTGNGNEAFEDGVQIVNLSGTLAITNGLYKDNAANEFEVQNGSGALTVNVNGAEFSNTTMPTTSSNPSNTTANAGLFLATHNNATMSPTITNCTVDRIYSQGIRLDLAGASSMTANIGPASGAGNGNNITNSNQGINITGTNTGGLTYNVRNNTLNITPAVMDLGATNQIGIARSTTLGTWTGLIEGNTVGTAGSVNSGCQVAGCDGIDIANNSAGTHILSIKGNFIHDTEGSGMVIIAGGAPDTSTVSWGVENNTITNPDQNTGAGNAAILIQSGTSTGIDSTDTCLKVAGNTISGTWSLGTGHQSSIRVRSFTTASGSFAIAGFDPTTNYPDDANGVVGSTTGGIGNVGNVADYIRQQNPGVTNAPILAPAPGNPGQNAASASQLAGSPAFTNSPGCTGIPIAPPAVERALNNGDRRTENGELTTDAQLAFDTAQPPSYAAQLPSDTAQSPLFAAQLLSDNAQSPSYVVSSTTYDAQTEYAAVRSVSDAFSKLSEMISPTVYAQDSVPNAPASGETVTLNTVATLPATKSITIKYSATVNAPPLARQVSTQGTVTANAGAISVLTDDPEPAGGPQATVTLVDTTMTWNGATSTDWNTITNWTQPAGGTQYAPGVSNPAVNDVVIPNVGAQPNISATDIGVFSLNIANGRTLTITSPRVLTIGGSPGGDLTLDGIISGGNLNLGNGTHVINNAGGTGSLSSTNVATVLSGSTVTLNNNLQAGALAVNTGGGAVMNISNRTLSLNGSGAALAIGAGATFTTTGSTVVFNGTAAQQAAGTAYNNLTINNTIGTNITGVTLTGNATVNGTLTLTSSDLATGAFTLTQPNTTASAGVSDVVGTVTRSGGPFPLATALTFGNPNNIITFTAGTNRPTTLTAVMAKTAPATYAAAVQRNYTISQTGSNNSTATVRLHYLDTELNGNTPEANLNLRRLRTSDSHWTAPPTTTRDTANNFIETTLLAATDLPTQWTFSTFVPTAANGTISGRIADGNGNPVEGAVINLSGDQTRKTITDANGNYHFNEVGVNGFYTVTPSRVNYNFTPFNRSFNLIGNTADAAFGAISTGDNRNPLDTPEYFVRQQYVDILGREPDEGGFNYWSDQINQCLSIPPGAGSPDECIRSRRVDVAAAFFIEAEFQQTGSFIYDLYRGALGRRPVFTEYSNDRRQVLGGPNLDTEKAAFAQSFVQRPEFVAKYQSNPTAGSFVDALIQNVQQVSGVDLSSQRDALIDHYNTGTDLNQSRSFVLSDVAANSAFNQAQYNPAFVLTEYFGYLQRNPDQGGYDFWLNVINDREVGNYRGMVCAFITSTEYQRRFSSVVSHGNGECAQ